MSESCKKVLYIYAPTCLKVGMADKNPPNKDEKEMLAWLKSQPGMYERLEQIRSLQDSDPDLDRAELELLELVQSLGASSFQQILQRKSDAAAERSSEEPHLRKHGKKN